MSDCVNGCDLDNYRTHQPGCPLMPHDPPCPCAFCWPLPVAVDPTTPEERNVDHA